MCNFPIFNYKFFIYPYTDQFIAVSSAVHNSKKLNNALTELQHNDRINDLNSWSCKIPPPWNKYGKRSIQLRVYQFKDDTFSYDDEYMYIFLFLPIQRYKRVFRISNTYCKHLYVLSMYRRKNMYILLYGIKIASQSLYWYLNRLEYPYYRYG